MIERVADDDLRRCLVCALEEPDVPPDLRDGTLAILWRYILDHRGSTDGDEVTAVGAAIRKFVAMADVSRVGQVAVLLETERAGSPIEIELEVAKMVYRKFEANPPAESEPEPVLARRLGEVAKRSLDPQVLPLDKHAAVAMLATQALTVMRSSRAEASIDAVNALPFVWFRQQLRQRLTDTAKLWAPAPRTLYKIY